MARIVIDTAGGQALLGAVRVPLADAGIRGELRIGGIEGPVLRPLAFGERTRLVTRAATTARSRDALCTSMLHAATVSAGSADARILEILALHLAGAGLPAPPFAEAALCVARSAGWDLAQILDAEAAEVDRLANALAPPPADGGWTRLVFNAGTSDELDGLRTELADDLLRRGVSTPRAAPELPPPRSATTAFGSADTIGVPRAEPNDGAAAGVRARPASSLSPASGRRAPVAPVDALRTARYPVELVMRLPRTASGTAGAITAMPAARIAPAAQQTIHATSPADRVPTAAPLHRQPETDPGSGLLARVQAPFRDWLPEAAQDHLFDAPIGAAPSAGDPSTNLWAAIATVTAANSAVEGAAGASFHEPDADLPTSRTPLESLADGVAALLHDEADLRGIDR